MKLKIKKLHPDAVIPKYQSSGASGFDLHALEDITILPGETKLVRTGLAIAISRTRKYGPLKLSFELQIRPRSGLSLKTPLRVANAPGTVDADFRGEVCVIMHNSSSAKNYELGDNNGSADPYLLDTQYIKKGDRIAQGVICPVLQVEFEEVEELDETQRGAGGFGSSGNK